MRESRKHFLHWVRQQLWQRYEEKTSVSGHAVKDHGRGGQRDEPPGHSGRSGHLHVSGWCLETHRMDKILHLLFNILHCRWFHWQFLMRMGLPMMKNPPRITGSILMSGWFPSTKFHTQRLHSAGQTINLAQQLDRSDFCSDVLLIHLCRPPVEIVFNLS